MAVFSRSRGFVPAWQMEGMILLAVVGIVLAIVIPAFVSSKTRWAAQDALKRVTPVTDAVSAYFLRTGRMPEDDAEFGGAQLKAAQGGSVKTVKVTGGTVVVELTGLGVNGKFLVLRPAVNVSSPMRPLRWACQGTPVPSGWDLIGGDQPVDQVDQGYLPQSCRFSG